MGNSIIDSVHTCYHCGNTGKLNYLNKTGWKNEDFDYDEYGEIIGYTLIEEEDWYIFECPVCNKPVIFSDYSFALDPDNNDHPVNEYPTIAVNKEGVPTEIYDAFDAAVKTKCIDRAICLLSLRRVLEMICKDKKATGHTLEAKIKDLINKNILTSTFEDACWITRQLGNEAAHGDKLKAYSYEVEQVIKYIALLIDYLYSMPYRAQQLRLSIEKKKDE